jgi:SAM-dependent methyltransferase
MGFRSFVRMNEEPASYHDLVIKDGRFIGRFEEMYQRFDDPWHQSEQPNRTGRWVAIHHLMLFWFRSVVEYGCGLGHYSDWIHRETGIVPDGVDISSTAVQKARDRFPHLSFRVGNVLEDLERPIAAEAILFAEIGWYILDDFQRILELLQEHHAGKYFLNNLVFYKGSQRYGTEWFTDLEGYIAKVPFELLGHAQATTALDSTIDTTTIFRIPTR